MRRPSRACRAAKLALIPFRFLWVQLVLYLSSGPLFPRTCLFHGCAVYHCRLFRLQALSAKVRPWRAVREGKPGFPLSLSVELLCWPGADASSGARGFAVCPPFAWAVRVGTPPVAAGVLRVTAGPVAGCAGACRSLALFLASLRALGRVAGRPGVRAERRARKCMFLQGGQHRLARAPSVIQLIYGHLSDTRPGKQLFKAAEEGSR
jgi:hypothetical protein